MALTKEQILGCQDIETKSVEIPQWGGQVLLRTMNGLEREQLEKRIQGFNKSGVSAGGIVRGVALVMSAIDDTGNYLFSMNDVESLAKKSGAALDRAFDEILSLNGMTKQDAEDLEKNSEEAPTGDSGSTSPE